MTVLEKLRKHAWLLVLFIGVSILTFVLTDMLGNRRGPGILGGANDLGSINGHIVTYEEFQAEVDNNTRIFQLMNGADASSEQATQQIRDMAWQDLLRKYVYDVTYENLGIAVSSDELFDLVQGRHPSPIVVNMFANPQTGQFDRANVARFLQNFDQQTDEAKAQWLYMEQQIVIQRLQTKLMNLVAKAMYVTNADAQNSLGNTATSVNLQYVSKPLTAYPDSLIKVSTSDIKNFYNANKRRYKQTESCDLEYVAFPINPSADDDQATREWVAKLEPEFKVAADVQQFVTLHSDEPFDATYHKKGELSTILDEFAFSSTKSDMLNVTLDDGAYKIARIADIKMLPDSVKARHILLQGQASLEAARKLADSIRTALKKGANFAELAAKYSKDEVANKKDGDLGWFTPNTMVKPFGDSCFFAPKGHIMVLETQFGVHIVQVTDKTKEMKKVQLGVVLRDLEPSKMTRERIFSQANDLASMSQTQAAFESNAGSKALPLRRASYVTINDRAVQNLQNARDLVRWAYNDAKKGMVSPVFEISGNFVVAVLTEVRENGYADVDQVKSEIQSELFREKKAAAIAAEMKGADNLNALATKENTTVQTLDNVTFSSLYLPNGVGMEPKLSAVASVTPVNEIFSPIEGNSAVYVINVTSVTNGVSDEKIPLEKTRLQAMVSGSIGYTLHDALMAAADVQDRRGKIY